MMDAMEDREVWMLNLELLSPQPSRKTWKKKKKKNLFWYSLIGWRNISFTRIIAVEGT